MEGRNTVLLGRAEGTSDLSSLGTTTGEVGAVQQTVFSKLFDEQLQLLTRDAIIGGDANGLGATSGIIELISGRAILRLQAISRLDRVNPKPQNLVVFACIPSPSMGPSMMRPLHACVLWFSLPPNPTTLYSSLPRCCRILT